MTSRVLSLAKDSKSPNIELRNRFACLKDEQPEESLWNPTPDVLPGLPETTTSFTTLNTDTTELIEKDQNSSEEEAAARNAHIGNVTLDTVSAENDLLRIEGKINGRRALMLIDSGSTHDFISLDFAEKNNLEMDSLEGSLCVSLANGRNRQYPSLQTSVKVVVGSFGEQRTFGVIPLTRYDVILGKPWL